MRFELQIRSVDNQIPIPGKIFKKLQKCVKTPIVTLFEKGDEEIRPDDRRYIRWVEPPKDSLSKHLQEKSDTLPSK